ncbi:phosphoribosyltransferase [Pleurocapsales cyanobacterium LEGE 10410]|nr:phosphoribosyltransferase [Pleurocapsales cyanobacterium LEGE 10410]
MMNFRTYDHMSSVLAKKLSLIPRDVDLIVGIPRSGLIPANILALHLNLPLTDLDGLIAGRMLGKGRTRTHAKQKATVGDCRKVLVIDDSLRTGTTIATAKQKIEEANISQEIVYAAVYVDLDVDVDVSDLVDIYFDICPVPRMFEWNFMHHKTLKRACIEIDGVLCENPTARENDNGSNYLEFLENAKPLFIPSFPVGCLVTSRLEKYRPQTERWLEKQGIKYGELLMLDLPDSPTQEALKCHAHFKSKIYRQTKSKIFIESKLKQALEIAKYSNKPVICTETRRLVYPNGRNFAEINYRQKQITLNLKRLKRKLRPLKQNMSRLLQKK